MKDVVIVFAVLLVLLLVISTLGGSLRYTASSGAPPSGGFPERFAQQEEEDTYAKKGHEAVPESAAAPDVADASPGPKEDIEGFESQDGQYASVS